MLSAMEAACERYIKMYVAKPDYNSYLGEAESSLAIENVSVEGSKAKISAADATAAIEAGPAVAAAADVTDMKASRWFYLDAKN